MKFNILHRNKNTYCFSVSIPLPYCRVLVQFEELNYNTCKFVFWFGELKQDVLEDLFVIVRRTISK